MHPAQPRSQQNFQLGSNMSSAVKRRLVLDSSDDDADTHADPSSVRLQGSTPALSQAAWPASSITTCKWRDVASGIPAPEGLRMRNGRFRVSDGGYVHMVILLPLRRPQSPHICQGCNDANSKLAQDEAAAVSAVHPQLRHSHTMCCTHHCSSRSTKPTVQAAWHQVTC